MQRLSALIRADREYESFLSAMTEAYRSAESYPIAVNGLSGGAEDAFIVESVIEARRLTGAPVLIMTGDESVRERILSSLLSAGLNAVAYKKRDLVFHNIRASHEVDRERLSVLYSLTEGELDAVVTTPAAASVFTVPRGTLLSLCVSLRVGDFLPPGELAERLVRLGFSRVESVEGVGQFSHRGGIVDFWGADLENPVRVEFFGDEIDRLAYFDAISQRTVEAPKSVRLLPASEVTVSKEARERLLSEVRRLIAAAKSDDGRERLMREEAVLLGDLSVDFRDKYLGLIYEGCENLFSYFDSLSRTVVLSVGTSVCRENLKKHTDYFDNEKNTLLSRGEVSSLSAKYTSGEAEYRAFLQKSLTVHINPFAGGVGAEKLSGLFGFRSRRTVSYGSNPAMLREDLENFRRALYRTVIVCQTQKGAESLISALTSDGFAVAPIWDKDINPAESEGGRIFVTVGSVDGYDLIMPKIAVLSMAEDKGRAIMQNRRRQRILREAGGAGKRLMSYADLSPGDYVVHASYGIGLFEGMEAVTVDGITKDYITIKYAGTDKLFVPCDRLEMIGKYIGAKDKDGKVKLSKMGGGDWQRTKTRAKSAAKDIAKELIALYAERQRTPGFAFPEDSELEYDFADSFEYDETDSQAQAIREIKADMVRPVPMNRLLCGDVGFGKTEVALRAAFKAIMGGKQVAFLVPTTILALQHFQTVISRMRSYPVTVDMLTRFKKPKEEAEILRRVKRGETDILIGTHKLLSKKLEFKNLGLLIVDEEQRFGVSQKEKLKEMAAGVDVLTLTATPIPRTLNMAMNGISDISILDEAPGERLPVQTYVLEHDGTVLIDAMRRELERGGQVLYLYNKVEDIAFCASKIMNELPTARVAYAHGQMERDEIEDIWQGLVRGEIDILVCTTIIETGVDLPNANTLIIENADRFGLSQLHQIRGRVGRSERQAYAYFTYRAGKALSEVAEKRLSTIKEYAEFGAGFKIALCDLEIRGAGNLLGAEQHGYIDSVGYDLYVKILNEAVREERGEVAEKRTESLVDMRVNAHIPESYVKASAARMEMYKKISLILTPLDASDVRDEMIDRFGDMPKPVSRLISVALVKALAERLGVERVEERGGQLTFVTPKPDLAMWSEAFAKYPGMRFSPSGDRVIYRHTDTECARLAEGILITCLEAKADESSEN